MNKPNILVVGSTMLDMIVLTDRVPLAGESRVVEAIKYAEGGKGANQAVTVAKMGADVRFSTAIGDDANGKRLLTSLENIGIDPALIEKNPSVGTGTAIIMLESDASNRIMVSPGANMTLSADKAIAYIKSAHPDAVLLQLEMPQQTVIDICNVCYDENIPVVLDAGPAQSFPLEKIKGLYILSPNETETFALCGIMPENEESAIKAAELIKSRVACEYVIIKRGGDGAYVYGNGVSENFAPPKVKCVDTTAAGDSFTAALTVMLASGCDIKNAVKYGNCAGALATTKEGAQPSLPTREEVEEMFQKTYGA